MSFASVGVDRDDRMKPETPDRPGATLAAVDAAREEIRRASRGLEVARTRLRRAIRRALDAGHSTRTVADRAGLSDEEARSYRRRA